MIRRVERSKARPAFFVLIERATGQVENEAEQANLLSN